VVYHASWQDERVLIGTLGDIAAKVEAARIDHSALIIVGDVVKRNGISEVSPIPESLAVLVFPRDRETGEKIVQALEERYQPTLILTRKRG